MIKKLVTNSTINDAEQIYQKVQLLISHLQTITINQPTLIKHLVIALLAGRHILLEGMPGTAKTMTINTLAQSLQAQFNRLQFTADMLPTDITGSDIFDPINRKLEWQPGPIFANFVLADEINRAPAKVQSALLEAMEEQQVTYGLTIHQLPAFFMVCATQNPLDRKGTWELPQAQLDRFMFKSIVEYPDTDTFIDILNAQSSAKTNDFKLTLTEIGEVKKLCQLVFIAPAIKEFIAKICTATHRNSNDLVAENKYLELIEVGVSPRAAINLMEAAKINAWLQQRDFVIPDDVINIIHPVIRHRLVPSFLANSQAISSDQIVDEILKRIVIAPNQKFENT